MESQLRDIHVTYLSHTTRFAHMLNKNNVILSLSLHFINSNRKTSLKRTLAMAALETKPTAKSSDDKSGQGGPSNGVQLRRPKPPHADLPDLVPGPTLVRAHSSPFSTPSSNTGPSRSSSP
jgi:hypothetical protein